VREADPVVMPLQALREYGIAVLVDRENRPMDVLTSADIDRVRDRAAKVTQSSLARELFARERPYLHSVKTQDDLTAVTRLMADNRLPAVVVVDENGRYAGYTESFVREAVRRAEVAQSRFPEAWSATGAPPPSSLKR
jgi:CBS domain-containing protein